MAEIVRTIVGNGTNPYIVTQGNVGMSLRKVGVQENVPVQTKKYVDEFIKRYYHNTDLEVIIPKKSSEKSLIKIISGKNSGTPNVVLEAVQDKLGNIKNIKTLDLAFFNNAKKELPNSAKRVMNLVAKFIKR